MPPAMEAELRRAVTHDELFVVKIDPSFVSVAQTLGCSKGQGYWFSPPLALGALVEWIAAQGAGAPSGPDQVHADATVAPASAGPA